MLISSSNIFSDALISRGRGAVKKVISDLRDQEDSASFKSLLKNTTEIQQKTSVSVKDESENSQKDMDSLFSKIDDGVETGIRLSLPDFMKRRNDGSVNVPEAFVSAETDPTSESLVSPAYLNDPEGSLKGENVFAFSLSNEPERESGYKIADGLFSSAMSENPEILSKRERGQAGDENSDSAVLMPHDSSQKAVDESEMISSVVSFTKSQLVENVPFKSATLQKNKKSASDYLSPLDQLKTGSYVSDGQKYEAVDYEKEYPGSNPEKSSDSELPRLVNDPEVINLQAINIGVTGGDKAGRIEPSSVSDKTEGLSSVGMVTINKVEDHLKDGVPLVESPYFSEVTKQNPASEAVSQIAAGVENKVPYEDRSRTQGATSENKGESSSHGVEKSVSSGFKDALSTDSMGENRASAFSEDPSENRGKESDRNSAEDLKDTRLQENLSIIPGSESLPSKDTGKGLLQTIPLQRGPEALSDGVANVVKFINSKGETRAQVIVDPPAIGKVQIEIHATPDGMEANLRVDTIAVREMIKNQLPLLQDMLAQQGISLSQMNVDVHSGDGSKGQWVEKNINRRRSVDEGEDSELDFTARIDLEQGLLVWTA